MNRRALFALLVGLLVVGCAGDPADLGPRELEVTANASKPAPPKRE